MPQPLAPNQGPRLPRADPSLTVTPVETAGWLLVARPWAVAHGLLWPSVDQIFAATRVNRAHAQAIADAIIAALPALCAEAAIAIARGLRLDALAHEALRFVMQHPDCVQRSASARYSARYRRFVIELRQRYADVPASEFAEALVVPLGTLEGWMRDVRGAGEPTAAQHPDERYAATHHAAQL